MSDHPILFSGEMVRAILDGRKTQTRRVMKPQPVYERPFYRWIPKPLDTRHCEKYIDINMSDSPDLAASYCPYGKPGDRLWVRETWRAWERESDGLDHIWYKADDAKIEIPNKRECSDFIVGKFDKWYPSIHMPRWASRLTLENVSVRVEHVQDISEQDAVAEGIKVDPKEGRFTNHFVDQQGNRIGQSKYIMPSARDKFKTLWDSINAKRGYSWDAKPWVWVVEFKRI